MMSPQEYSPDQIDEAVGSAHRAFSLWSSSESATRANLLRTLAAKLEAEREALVAIADRETSLGLPRLNGELARTAFQLRGFADEVQRGAPYATVDDETIEGAPPQGRPHLLRVRVPLGPVAMFAASNFPFAFSVLGGDTASILAAGCPVVVKAHPGHPELSRSVHDVAQATLAEMRLPAGVIGMVQGGTPAVGVHLVRHPLISAAAFTGSVAGGLALQSEAQKRPRPIPFFGELGSINPVVILPAAFESQSAEALAQTLAQSIGMGCGQFCTSPGLVVVQRGDSSDAFLSVLAREVGDLKPHAMLNANIRRSYAAAVERRAQDGRLSVLTYARRDVAEAPAGFLARINAGDFIAAHDLHEEVFGPAALVVVADSLDEIDLVLRAVGGSLTVTVWGAESPKAVERLIRTATHVAGRVLFKGVPTGVAVTAAQHHGGPYPSSTEPATTSVGYAALGRFLRPVALQDPPSWICERGGRPL